MKRAARCFLLVGVLCWTLVGCQPSKPATVAVSGTVTWQGKPLPAGDVLFVAEDGLDVPDHDRVKDGHYQLQVKPGKKKVEIYAERTSGQRDPVMGQVPRQQYLPARYNTATQLRADVQAGKDKHFDFTLADEVTKP